MLSPSPQRDFWPHSTWPPGHLARGAIAFSYESACLVGFCYVDGGGGVLALDKKLQVPPTLRKNEKGDFRPNRLEPRDNTTHMTHNRAYFPKGQKWN